ncbi:MAG: cyclopropane mycolic acid synthase family methyltransferase [Betaproteobacteria bacterium]
MTELRPNYRDVQAHYDLSGDFFALFLDASRTYSCAYFERDELTLEQAQLAKIDLALGKCELEPGMRLLDIGCGWGALARRAAQRHGVRVVGLTLSRNQQAYAARMTRGLPVEIRLQGWEEFDEPVDRIVSIGAFEHFREARFADFFAKCHRLLPVDAHMLLHTIVFADQAALNARGIALDHDNVLFAKFVRKHIFPGGQLVVPRVIRDYARAAGFEVEREHSLQQHYARTLDTWAVNLAAARERAIALTGEGAFDIYMKYLTGCAERFRSGYIDVIQFTLVRLDREPLSIT